MGWLLSKLKKFLEHLKCEPELEGYTLYTREKGPICYQIHLFLCNGSAYPSFPQLFTQQLLSSGLRWYWESNRRWDPAPEYAGLGLPKVRDLTALTEATADEFARDLQEHDLDGDMRNIVLYGIDPSACPGSEFHTWLRNAFQEFLTNEQGPLWLVVYKMGDDLCGQVFVTHTPPPPVQALLQAWGVLGTKPRRVCPYRWLGVAMLEYLVSSFNFTWWAVEPGHSGKHLYKTGYPDRFEEQRVLYFRTTDELKQFLRELERDPEGSIHVFKEWIMPVSRWERLLGIEDRLTYSCFRLYWYGDYAALVFQNEQSGSEYYALDQEPAMDAPTEIRIRLKSKEDGTPILPEQCMYKARAFKAAREFLDTGKWPEWLSYRYIR